MDAPNHTHGPGHRGWHSRRYMPHFDAPRTQAVTFHLADSLPREVIDRMRTRIEAMPEEQRDQESRRKIEAYADAGHGCCVLRNPEIAQGVQKAFLHFHQVRYSLHAWVIMPNHVHVMFRPMNQWRLGDIVASGKKFTGRNTAEFQRARMGIPDALTNKPVWRREYWDQYMRDESHYHRCHKYIYQNPVKAGLVAQAEEWPWSSANPANAELLVQEH